MDISIYFEPAKVKDFNADLSPKKKTLGHRISAYLEKDRFPDYDDAKVAFMGIHEDRKSTGNEGCQAGPDEVRRELYRLYPGGWGSKMVDLGNIRQGHAYDDTLYAVTEVMAELLSHDIIPVVLGGGQDLTYAIYRAYEKIGRIINIAAVDPRFDVAETEGDNTSSCYLSNIIMHQPSYLFNYTNIGYQTYLVDQGAISLMRNLYFDAYRLGHVRSDLEEMEPLVRNADLLTIDIGAVRASDAPGNANALPNGFYGEELCQLTRYAGLSEKVSCLGFFEYNPMFERQGLTASLISQAIWYFLDGFHYRRYDFPKEEGDNYIKFNVSLKELENEMLFYKSKATERWWMKVPYHSERKPGYRRHQMVPCSHRDYEMAMENTIPDRWWQTYQKLM
jgi:arginase family enzyme